MASTGVNRDYLKKSNRGLALKLIATQQCKSRIELSRAMGLTKTAISTIVNELMEKGYLIETNKQLSAPPLPGEAEAAARAGRLVAPAPAQWRDCYRGEPGPKPIGLEIGPKAPKFAGVLIQRGYVEVATCDMNMRILRYSRVERDWYDADTLMGTVFELLDRLIASGEAVAAIGVSSIGPVDLRRGAILRPMYFNGIGDIAVTEAIRARYGLPVRFDHDNQSAALVEQLYGNGRGYQDILMIGIGKGVGCGIVTGGRRYQSHNGLAPEIGHVSINGRGNSCVCGNVGCLETYIMTPVIERKVAQALGRRMSYREICQAENVPAIDAVMEAMVQDLSCAVVSLLNILNFEIVLLGLDGIYWPARYVELLEQTINDRKFSGRETRTLVRKVGFLEKTQILGAVCNAVNCCFEGELVE